MYFLLNINANIQFYFSKRSNRIYYALSRVYNLSKSKYEAALIELSKYNSIPNIKKNVNNIFRYLADNGITWKDISLNIRSHKIEDISNEIERQLVDNEDYDVINETYYIAILQPRIVELNLS